MYVCMYHHIMCTCHIMNLKNIIMHLDNYSLLKQYLLLIPNHQQELYVLVSSKKLIDCLKEVEDKKIVANFSCCYLVNIF